MQGEKSEVLDAIAAGKIDGVEGLPEKEHALLEFVRKITLSPAKIEDRDTASLRESGWSDEEIAECVYVASMFAFFNRVADAFGLEDPGYLQEK